MKLGEHFVCLTEDANIELVVGGVPRNVSGDMNRTLTYNSTRVTIRNERQMLIQMDGGQFCYKYTGKSFFFLFENFRLIWQLSEQNGNFKNAEKDQKVFKSFSLIIFSL